MWVFPPLCLNQTHTSVYLQSALPFLCLYLSVFSAVTVTWLLGTFLQSENALN